MMSIAGGLHSNVGVQSSEGPHTLYGVSLLLFTRAESTDSRKKVPSGQASEREIVVKTH
jgi:hypothetical protein